MAKHLVLQYPKTQIGADLCATLNAAIAGPRNSLAAILIQTVMAWAHSDRTCTWNPFREAVTVKCDFNPQSALTRPLYALWESGYSEMPFAAWLAMASYYGFIRLKDDQFLAPTLAPFYCCGEQASAPAETPPIEPTPAPTAAKNRKVAAKHAKPSNGVRGLKGMFPT